MAHYEVIDRKVFANVAKLTERELLSVKNYLALGYELVERKPQKKKGKGIYNKVNLIAYIKAKDKEDGTDNIKIFDEKWNEPVLDEDGKQMITSKGKLKVKGYMNAYHWFMREYGNINLEDFIKGKKKK